MKQKGSLGREIYGFMFENSSSEPEVEAEDVISVEENQGEENED
jgi:hypothetical protein